MSDKKLAELSTNDLSTALGSEIMKLLSREDAKDIIWAVVVYKTTDKEISCTANSGDRGFVSDMLIHAGDMFGDLAPEVIKVEP